MTIRPEGSSLATDVDFERALLESQSEASPDGILVASLEGKILSFNSRFSEMWGIPRRVLEEGGDDASRALVMEQLANADGFMERVRYLYAHPDEHSLDELNLKDGRIVERFSAPIQRDGKVLGRVWFFRDVTGPRRSQRRLRAQFEITQVVAGDGTIEDVAEELLSRIGETLGWEVASLWMVDEEAEVLRAIATWNSGRVVASEFDELTRSSAFGCGEGLPGRAWEAGEPIWIKDATDDPSLPRAKVAAKAGLHTGIAFPLIGGETVYGIIDAFGWEAREPDEDLLSAKATLGRLIGQFIERTRAEEAIRESEARKTGVLESALDAIISMDHQGRIVEFNPAAQEVFGRSRDEVLGKEMAALIIPKPLRDRHRDGLAKFLETGEGPLIGRRIEVSAVRADGTEFPVELAISAITTGVHPVFTGYIRDISDVREAEKERAALLAAERDALAAAELAQKQLAYLAEASRVLSSSLDYRQTLAQMVRLAVPHLADWCAVHMAEGENPAIPIAVAHIDPEKVSWIQEFQKKYPPNPDAPTGTPNVMRTGKPELYPEVTDEMLVAAAVDDEHLEAIRSIDFKSAMIVPLNTRDRTLGAITFVSTTPERLYGPQDLSFVEDVARRAASAIENARLYESQANVSRTLQRSLLPTDIPEIPGLEIAARYDAAVEGNEVGGDFYDVIPLGGKEWAVVIGDVCGKGAEAAAITGLARHTLRAVAMRESDPTRLLETLNEAMLRQSLGERFATVAIAKLTVDEGSVKVEVVCGGHPEPLLLNNTGELERLGEAGTVLGLFTGVDLTPRTAIAGSGDVLLLYTDGVTEARGENNRIFGQYRLTRSFAECTGMSAQEVVDHIYASASEFERGGFRDDMAILALKIR